MSEKIAHPCHYQVGKIEPIEVINDWNLGFNLGNVIKYIARAGRKPDETILDDLRKARFYLDDCITRLEEDSEMPQSVTARYGKSVEDDGGRTSD